jgi:hypothetical protein
VSRTTVAERFRLQVVAGGKGGRTFAMEVARARWRVALVEHLRVMVGGTCINRACIATKTLIRSAEVAERPAGWVVRRRRVPRRRGRRGAARAQLPSWQRKAARSRPSSRSRCSASFPPRRFWDAVFAHPTMAEGLNAPFASWVPEGPPGK